MRTNIIQPSVQHIEKENVRSYNGENVSRKLSHVFFQKYVCKHMPMHSMNRKMKIFSLFDAQHLRIFFQLIAEKIKLIMNDNNL